MFDIPIEWLTWVYGKWFVGHPVRGFICVSVPFCTAFLLALGFGWLRAVDKYTEKIPKVEAVASSSAPSRDTTAKPPDPAPPKPAAKKSQSHPKAPKTAPAQPSALQQCAPGANCAPLVNSIIENEGEIRDLDIDSSHAYAAKGGKATVIKNLPGGKVTGGSVTDSKSSQGPEAVQDPAPIQIGPGTPQRLHIHDSVYCDSDETMIQVQKGGVLSGRVENNKAINCAWVFALGIIGANPDNLKSNLDKFEKGLEVGWNHLAEGERNENRLEWSRISSQLLNASPESLKSTVDSLIEHPPGFDVSLGYMAIEQK